VLLAAEGLTNNSISAESRVEYAIVGRWRSRFAADRVGSLPTEWSWAPADHQFIIDNWTDVAGLFPWGDVETEFSDEGDDSTRETQAVVERIRYLTDGG
jgi:hypothetical protein